MNSNIPNIKLLTKFEKYCYSRLYNNYNTTPKSFNKLIISNIIYNNKLHIVCCFKEFLIFFDPGDFLSAFYKKRESRESKEVFSTSFRFLFQPGWRCFL